MTAFKLTFLLLLLTSEAIAQTDNLYGEDLKPSILNVDTTYLVELSLQQDAKYGFTKVIPVHGNTSDILNSISKWATETFTGKDGQPYQIDRDAALFSSRPNVKVMWSSKWRTDVWNISFTWIVYVKEGRVKVSSSEYKYWSGDTLYSVESLNAKKEEIIMHNTSRVISNLLASMIKSINDKQDW